jgi:hypothetical protein
MKCFDNFEQLMVNEIIPFQNKNSSWIRLDGQNSGGNRDVFACFYHNSKKWKIHSDTHFDELFKAYKDIIAGIDPFIETSTRRSNNLCLELRHGLASRPKHIYIYINE